MHTHTHLVGTSCWRDCPARARCRPAQQCGTVPPGVRWTCKRHGWRQWALDPPGLLVWPLVASPLLSAHHIEETYSSTNNDMKYHNKNSKYHCNYLKYTDINKRFFPIKKIFFMNYGGILNERTKDVVHPIKDLYFPNLIPMVIINSKW